MEKAVAAYGVPEERISFTVLEEPKKGLFGMKWLPWALISLKSPSVISRAAPA